MGGNIFSNLKQVEYPDFTGERAKYEALKHAELARKLQTQQALQQQEQFAHTKEGWQRDKDWQAALAGNPLIDPETGQMHPTTMKTLMGINPVPTLKLAESIADQSKARTEAEIKKQAWLEKQQELALHDIDSGMKITDPQERLTYVMQNWERYKKLKVLTDDEHEELARTGLTVPLHDRMATRLLGAEKFGEYQKKALELTELQADAAEKAKTRGAVTQKTLDEADAVRSKRVGVKLFNSSDQGEWDRNVQELPEAERGKWIGTPFNHQNRYKALMLGQTPTEILTQERLAKPDSLDKIEMQLADPTLPADTRQRLEAARKGMIDWRNQVKPKIEGDISGQIATILANPSLYHQMDKEGKGKLMAPLAAAGFTQWEAPPPEAYRQKLTGIAQTRAALEQYRKHLDSYDALIRPGTPEYATLDSSYQGLALKAKDAAGLGALAGPDMGILNKWITPPTSWTGRYSGKETLKKQLEAYETQLDASENALRGTYNQPLREPKKPAPDTSGNKPAPNALLQPGEVIVDDPKLGKITLPNQATADAYKKKYGIK